MRLSFFLFFVVLATSNGARDDSYYPAGMENPNVDNPMYWKDASNVLEDLSSFRALYVKFHACADSYYAEGCNSEGDEEGATWYMGYSECTRPNVAYSLYGELSGEPEAEGCAKGTYINSFFTTNGIETFTEAMENVGKSFTVGETGDDNYAGGVNSYCTAVYNQNENGENQNNNQGGENNNYYGTHGSKVYPYSSAYSFGVGCLGKKFALKTYNGAFCDENSVKNLRDRLKTFNSEMNDLGCVKIYSKYSNANNGEEEQGRDGEDNALDLLYYSKACSIREFPRACPDPWGRLSAYTRQLEHHTGVVQNRTARTVKEVFSWIFIACGIMLVILGFAAVYVRERRRILILRKKRYNKATAGKKVFRRRSRSRERSDDATVDTTQSKERVSDYRQSRSKSRARSRSRSFSPRFFKKKSGKCKSNK